MTHVNESNWAARTAARIRPYRELLEFVLLFAGAAWGLAFLVRTWPYPHAILSLEVLERRPADTNTENLVVRTSFQVGDSANLDVQASEPSCKIMDTKALCSSQCTEGRGHLEEGRLPRGEAVSWACKYRVPKGACVEVSQIVVGKAAGLAAARSGWRSSTISCGGGEK